MIDKTKRKIFIGLFISIFLIVFILIGTFFLYPLPLEESIPNHDDLVVYYQEINIINGEMTHETADYHFDINSEEIGQIKKILSKYHYHRNLRFFVENDHIKGNLVGYWISLYSGENRIHLGGTNKIQVNNHVYNIGYWGENEYLSLMEEVRNILGIE